jgi:hypothetical protein
MRALPQARARCVASGAVLALWVMQPMVLVLHGR